MKKPFYSRIARFQHLFLAVFCASLCTWLLAGTAAAQRSRRAADDPVPAKTIRVQTLPKATVWMDEVKRGVADESGALEIRGVLLRRHTVRVRASGFKELSRAVPLPLPSTLTIKPTLRADDAELSFQAAEAAELTAKDDAARKQVVTLYQQALAARRIYPEAHLGLARVLSELGDNDAALEQVAQARSDRPNYAEASAVEGRIKRTQFDLAGAVVSFKRSIREARGPQPEAHTGLALVYQDQGEDAAAAAEFELALDQLSDTEPVIYQLLGAIYEKLEKYPEAVAAYEKYLKLAPNGNLAPAIRSVIDQLRRQAKGETPLG